jgi:hypothetical protein
MSAESREAKWTPRNCVIMAIILAVAGVSAGWFVDIRQYLTYADMPNWARQTPCPP